MSDNEFDIMKWHVCTKAAAPMQKPDFSYSYYCKQCGRWLEGI